MRNQLRAAFYLLSRSAYLKGAVVLTVLMQGFRIWMVLNGASFGLQDSLLGDYLVRFFCCLVPVGMAGLDQHDHAWRSSCSSESGRVSYMASRMVTTAVSATALVLLNIALDAVTMLVFPDASLLLNVSSMNSPARLLAQWLAVVTFAELAQLLCWWTGRQAASMALAFLIAQFNIFGLLLGELFRYLAQFFPVFLAADDVLGVIFLAPAFAKSVFSVGMRSMMLFPIDPFSFYVMPLIDLAVVCLLSWRVMAKKAL